MEKDRATIFAPECRYKSWLGQSKGINYHWFTRSRIIGGLVWLTRHKPLSSMCHPLSWKACKVNLICPSKSWFYSRHCYISMGRMPAYIPSFVNHPWKYEVGTQIFYELPSLSWLCLSGNKIWFAKQSLPL